MIRKWAKTSTVVQGNKKSSAALNRRTIKWSFVRFGGMSKSGGISEHDLSRVNAIDVTKFITIAYNSVQRLAHVSTRSSEDTAAHHNRGLYAGGLLPIATAEE